jgi:hypothetical protein
MDVEVTQADGTEKLYTGIKELAITDNDSSESIRAKLTLIQAHLANLSKLVAEALAV